MKAEIRMELERPSRIGRKIITENIVAKKESIDEKVSDFIFNRQHLENYIRVRRFNVTIKDYKGNFVHQFSYTPTYR